jgi:hypothetical protein
MKLKLKILNIFYLIFSAVAVAAYVLNANSFLNATFSYKVNSDLLLEESIDESALDELGINSDDLFSDIDTIVFEVQVNVGYADLLRAWTEAGPDYDYYEDSKYTAIERYSMKYILAPAFDNVPDWLYEDLCTIANTAIAKMIENCATTQLRSDCMAVTGEYDFFTVMETNPKNTQNYNKKQFDGAISGLAADLYRAPREDVFMDGMTDNGGQVLFEGLKDKIRPYFVAIKDPADANERTVLANCMDQMVKDVDKYLKKYGVVDDEERITYIEEAIGTILQHLVDHEDYEEDLDFYDDDDYEDDDYERAMNNKFISKFFAPLKAYIEEDSEFDNELTELFINVLRNSRANGYGENDTLFRLIVVGIRAFGVLLVLFMLAWAIKFIMAFISFFKQRPFIRLNPLFIVTGTIEALLALLTLGSVIIYNNFDMNTIRTMIPAVQTIIPIGLSFQFIFACWIPGVIAIINLLFSMVYGPVKKKFKQDSRDEILYSTDFNDYE